jgi:polyisoprenoid-binding protein YceI
MLKHAHSSALQALACSLLVVGTASGEPREFDLDADASRVHVHVKRGGLLSFMGHNHEIEAPLASGVVVVDSEDVTASSVRLAFETAALKVVDPDSPKDIDEVQTKMESPDVLDVARYPGVSFHSTSVEGFEKAGVWQLEVKGMIELHGAKREIKVPLTVRLDRDSLMASGRFEIQQKDFGMTPVSIAGVVKVKNELEIEFTFSGSPSIAKGSGEPPGTPENSAREEPTR